MDYFSTSTFKPNYLVGGGISLSLGLWAAGMIADQRGNHMARDRFFIGRSVVSLATVGLITYDIKRQQKLAQDLRDAAAANPAQFDAIRAAAGARPHEINRAMITAQADADANKGGFWRWMGSLTGTPTALEGYTSDTAAANNTNSKVATKKQAPALSIASSTDSSDIANFINKQLESDSAKKGK